MPFGKASAGTAQGKPGEDKRGGGAYSSTTKTFLEALGIGPTQETTTIEMAPKTDRYMQIADLIYYTIVDIVPEAAKRLGPKSFRHIARLWFSRRCEDVRFWTTGSRPHASVRTPMPKGLTLPQPVWDMLCAVGEVEDPQSNKIYTPRHCLPQFIDREHQEYSADYIECICECTGQDWKTSWREAEEEIRSMATAGGDYHDEPASLRSIGDGARITSKAGSRAAAKANLELFDKGYSGKKKYILNGILYVFDDPKYDTTAEDDAELSKVASERREFIGWSDWKGDFTRDMLVQDIFAAKNDEQRWRPAKPTAFTPNPTIAMDVDGDIGAYGRDLGWSPSLWIAYQDFVRATESAYMYSLSFPNEKVGTMAWVLPAETTPEGSVFTRGPTRLVPPADYALAAIMQMAHWTHDLAGWVSNWRVKSEYLGAPDHTVVEWVRRAVKRTALTQTAYT
jgi:hypothetical protein